MYTREDWYRVTSQQLRECGGNRILCHYGSIYNALVSAFPEVKWDATCFEKVPAKYWDSSANRKNFFESVRRELKLEMSDWGKLTTQQFKELGGAGLLDRYGGSLFRALVDNYEDYDWSKTDFSNINPNPQHHWDNIENSRIFLDQIGKKLGIKKPSDWGKIPIKNIQLLHGSGLLHKYQNSLYRTLLAVYSEVRWKQEWFENVPRYSREHWNSFKHQKDFIDEISKDYDVEKFSDWQRITQGVIKARGGLVHYLYITNSIRDS